MTNIKLPELRDFGHAGPAQLQIEKCKDVGQSEALRFDPRKNRAGDIFGPTEDESDLDRALTNIRSFMLSNNLKLQTISVQQIDQIYRFSTLNDYTSKKTLEEIITKEMERIQFELEDDSKKKKRMRVQSGSLEVQRAPDAK